VRVGDSLISVTFYDPTRLQQEIVDDIEAGRLFTMKRLLVIELVTIENMQWAVAQAPSEFYNDQMLRRLQVAILATLAHHC
jgi:hypothetical protein